MIPSARAISAFTPGKNKSYLQPAAAGVFRRVSSTRSRHPKRPLLARLPSIRLGRRWRL
jgi:hypothetical protein